MSTASTQSGSGGGGPSILLEPAPAGLNQEQREQFAQTSEIDASCRGPVLFMFGSAVVWLIVGTVFALIASIKLHNPRFIADVSWLTFGRVRPAHLTVVAFGWSAMAGLGVLLWLMCRLCRVPLRFPGMLVLAGVLWNIGVIIGTGAILAGYGNSIEWIEYPHYAVFLLFLAFGIFGLWALLTFANRREKHVYVSQWYLFGAIFWFPWIYASVELLMNSPWAIKGVSQESVHWWFGHNVLGVFFTPIGLASAYYLIPKVIGRPIYSYNLSILGFWSLALFYQWAGAHHLVGGPIPAWLVTVSIVGSMMMFIPVTTTAINHHMTTKSHFGMLKYSPTLRFVVFGAMCYTVVSFQGSLMALRIFNEPTHFTHHTIAHAHLGLYAFFTMVMFGSMYYIVPRLTNREWASSRLIRLHFWATGVGILLMFGILTLGGAIQGFEMNQASESFNTLVRQHGLWGGTRQFFSGFKAQNGAVPFLTIVHDTVPWLVGRSVSGVLIAVGHLAFATLVALNFSGRGRQRVGPTLFIEDMAGYKAAMGD